MSRKTIMKCKFCNSQFDFKLNDKCPKCKKEWRQKVNFKPTLLDKWFITGVE